MKLLAVRLAVALSLVLPFSASATFKVGLGIDKGLGVTAQIDNVQLFAGNDGVSADYLFKAGNFEQTAPLSWYLGAGAYMGEHDYGLRMPLGIKFYFARGWELYGQLAPQLEMHDEDHRQNDDEIQFGLSSAIGVRYSF
ncbi:hypothetical protein DXV75_02665 [Alteromonas aestuariivivens]|uniref:Outer membrane protein beta-barrel domain-containing protein n=1 Tax=Alteromonas aestuariivivens TaxID=1938339 RepID=A0A3D8MGM5_9ALTE|nr:hypothetical protein [Alteromonas aestuariivivens]RDV29368.1 hypothetical protein DXV75_02665 [Alteromonas aestuariivivens]